MPISPLVAARTLADRRRRGVPSTPTALAARLDPTFRVTPTIAMLGDLAARSVREPDQRDIVTTPPRTGKSRLLAIWTVVWALADDPDREVVLVSYSDELAQAHSREARQLIAEHADALGIRLSPDKTAVGRWRVEGRRGGLLATGINSGVTGFGADLLIIDDPVKDAAEADSAAHRRRVVAEYHSTLSTRLHPGGSVLLVMTRWHEHDHAGELLDAAPDVRHSGRRRPGAVAARARTRSTGVRPRVDPLRPSPARSRSPQPRSGERQPKRHCNAHPPGGDHRRRRCGASQAAHLEAFDPGCSDDGDSERPALSLDVLHEVEAWNLEISADVRDLRLVEVVGGVLFGHDGAVEAHGERDDERVSAASVPAHLDQFWMQFQYLRNANLHLARDRAVQVGLRIGPPFRVVVALTQLPPNLVDRPDATR